MARDSLSRAYARHMCDPVQGFETASCAQCMGYGRQAGTKCVYAGCQWRNYEGDCVEGRDRLKVATGMWMVAFGWLMMVWVGGWARRNCGRVQKLQRRGRRISAQTLHTRHEQRTVIAGGWPIKANVFTVRIRYPTEAEGGGWLVREVNVSRADFESLEDDAELAVVVDAADEQFVLAAAVVDAPSERFGWIVLSITGVMLVPALLVGGMTTMLDAYYCMPGPPVSTHATAATAR